MNIPFHFVGRLMQHHCQKDGWYLQNAIYGSFAQHKTKLRCEDARFILATLPSTIVAELEASIGQVFAKLIEAIFLGPACDPRNGLYMPHPVTSMDVMLYFALGGFVHGLAMKQTFNIKGASGDKFCMLCSNIRAIPLDLPPNIGPRNPPKWLQKCEFTI